MVRRQRANNPALSYLGVSAEAPPDVVIIDRDPTQNDIEFEISTLWLRRESTKRAFMLLGKEQGIATWVQLYPVGGSPGAQNFITANGTATVNNGDITVAGGIGLQARASGANEFLIEPDQPNLGFIFMSGVGFRPVTSPDNSIDINFAPTGLELQVATSVAQGARNFQTDSGVASSSSGTLDILGGQNIATSGAGNTVTVATQDAINLPDTVNTFTGVYKLGGNRIIHNRTPGPGLDNLFIGKNAANFAFVTTAAANNLAVGNFALFNLTSATANLAIGYNAGFSITNGSSNTIVGQGSLQNATTASGNIVFGLSSANNYLTSNENDNIIIGNRIPGLGNESNTIRIGAGTNGPAYQRFFAAGIHNTTPASGNQQTVIVDDQGQLGATTAGAATDVVASVITNSGTATPNSSDELEILGGQNINTRASGNDVIVATDDSIDLPDTTGTTVGTYRIDGDPVVHIYGAANDDANLFLGVNSGNFTLTTTSAQRNTGVGTDTLFNLTSGANNVAAGAEALQNLTSGNDNIGVGFGAGSAYTTSESNNILIGNDGAGGDMNTIRIGEQGTQTRAFMHGIYLVNPPGVSAQYVVVDNNGQLGSTDYSGTGGVEAKRVEVVAHLPSDLQVSGDGNPLPPSDGGTASNLGEDIALVEDQDNNNDFFPGDGAGTPAEFVVPRDGRYIIDLNPYNGSEPFPATVPVSGTGGTITKYELSEPELSAYTVSGSPRLIICSAGSTNFTPIGGRKPGQVTRKGEQRGTTNQEPLDLPAGTVIRFSINVGQPYIAPPLIQGGSDFLTGKVTNISIREVWSTGF